MSRSTPHLPAVAVQCIFRGYMYFFYIDIYFIASLVFSKCCRCCCCYCIFFYVLYLFYYNNVFIYTSRPYRLVLMCCCIFYKQLHLNICHCRVMLLSSSRSVVFVIILSQANVISMTEQPIRNKNPLSHCNGGIK